MTGISFLIAFVVAVLVMLLLISKYKVHPFLSIMAISLVLAFLAGIPMREKLKAVLLQHVYSCEAHKHICFHNRTLLKSSKKLQHISELFLRQLIPIFWSSKVQRVISR